MDHFLTVNSIVSKLRQDLRENVDEKTLATGQHYFKEKIQLHGVTIPATQRIARSYFPLLDSLTKKKVFALCEELWKSGYLEESFVASEWSFHIKDQFEPGDFVHFCILLTDPDDLVQKGYGWMLKAASQSHQQEVFSFVMDHKKDMPRTALRYSIEKMPEEWRRKAMAK